MSFTLMPVALKTGVTKDTKVWIAAVVESTEARARKVIDNFIVRLVSNLSFISRFFLVNDEKR